MELEIDKTFNFYIPSDSGDVLVTGQMWAENVLTPIKGWESHAFVYFNFTAEVYPEVPSFEPGETLVFLMGPGEDLRMGRMVENSFIEIPDVESDGPTYMQYLFVNLLEISLLNPPRGHFDYTSNSIYPK